MAQPARLLWQPFPWQPIQMVGISKAHAGNQMGVNPVEHYHWPRLGQTPQLTTNKDRYVHSCGVRSHDRPAMSSYCGTLCFSAGSPLVFLHSLVLCLCPSDILFLLFSVWCCCSAMTEVQLTLLVITGISREAEYSTVVWEPHVLHLLAQNIKVLLVYVWQCLSVHTYFFVTPIGKVIWISLKRFNWFFFFIQRGSWWPYIGTTKSAQINISAFMLMFLILQKKTPPQINSSLVWIAAVGRWCHYSLGRR